MDLFRFSDSIIGSVKANIYIAKMYNYIYFSTNLSKGGVGSQKNCLIVTVLLSFGSEIRKLFEP